MMLLRSAKRFTSALWRGLGIEVKRVDGRPTLVGALKQVKQAGLSPQTVIDVGAAWGDFTVQCRSVFPDARYVLVEPLEEYRTRLDALFAMEPNVECIQAAAASAPGEVSLHVHPDLVGSSLHWESEDSDVNGEPRNVTALTLDSLAAQKALTTPYLLKVDVQGAELTVLQGAREVLRSTDYVVLEASLFQFFDGGPIFHDVIAFMKSAGFAIYDVVGRQDRPLDHALAQLDIAFVKVDGPFRKHQYYATPQQRAKLTRRMAPRK